MALTSFLTGVTEPIEFAFMFLAPLLVRTARAADRPRDGDHGFLLGAPRLRLLGRPVRLRAQLLASRRTRCCCCRSAPCYFALYYGVFRFAIVRFDLKTPGREPEEGARPSKSPAIPGPRVLGARARRRGAISFRWMPARRGCASSSPTVSHRRGCAAQARRARNRAPVRRYTAGGRGTDRRSARR